MGVMPDTVKVIAVFVIAGVGAFDIVNLLLKLVFRRTWNRKRKAPPIP